MRRILPVILCIVAFLPMKSQTPLDKSPLGTPSLISPYYFGPNAFRVPEVLDGRVQGELCVELAGEYFNGNRGDHTADAALKVNVPLWTNRANLSLWMPVQEWYHNSSRNMEVCRIDPARYDEARKGHLAGDVYVSADMQLVREGVWRGKRKAAVPDWVLRAALRTASGGEFYHARYYDGPGYFFDTSVAKSLNVGHNIRWGHSLRLALSTGFLCWQTDNGRQNDAVQWGILAKWDNTRFSLSASLAGYNGWEHNASNGGKMAYDRPAVVRTNFNYHVKRFDIVAAYERGLRDYPYQMGRLGLVYRCDILKMRK